MSDCSSPVPSMSCDESVDRDEEYSVSTSTGHLLLESRSFSDKSEMNEFKSAFRAISAGTLTMQQRLLAMLQSEMPQTWRPNSSESCSTMEEGSPTKNFEQRAGENEADYFERRRKNNDSARRSREVRRRREVANRQQVEVLEKENVQLRAQIALLRLEVGQLSLVLMAEGVKPLS